MNLDILEFISRCKLSKFHTENNSSSYAENMEWNDRLVELLREKAWSVPDLARAIGGSDVQALSERLYKYAKRSDEAAKPVPQPRGRMMEDIARALGVTEEFLRFGRDTLPPTNAVVGGPLPITRSRIPIYGHAAGGQDGRFILNGEKVGEIYTPPSLEAVADAYSVYVHGESMVPRYEPGEVVHVNPHRPARQGDYVVIQIRTGDDELAGFVKRFVSRSSKELVVEQLNPPRGHDRLMRFPSRDVVHVHKIVGSGEG